MEDHHDESDESKIAAHATKGQRDDRDRRSGNRKWSGHVVEYRLRPIGHPPAGDDCHQPDNGCSTGPTLGERVSETERVE